VCAAVTFGNASSRETQRIRRIASGFLGPGAELPDTGGAARTFMRMSAEVTYHAEGEVRTIVWDCWVHTMGECLGKAQAARHDGNGT